MNSSKLFSDWYGYDKKVYSTQTFDSQAHSVLKADSANMYGKGEFQSMMPPDVANEIVSFFPNDSNARRRAGWAWRPESDGYTDEDFLKWMKSHTPESITKNTLDLPWYMCDEWPKKLFLNLREFFTPDAVRSDRFFRYIEMSEFMARGDDSQTFQNFLETDTEYIKKCRALDLNNLDASYSTVNLLDLQNDKAPLVFRFGSQVGQRTRDLFLPLTKNELQKVVDYKNNDLSLSNFRKSYTYDWVELFIKSALGKYKRPSVSTMSLLDIQNCFLRKIMENWNINRTEKRLVESQTMSDVCRTISSMTLKDEGLRFISYLISKNALNSLSPLELITILTAAQKSNYWAEDSRHKSPLDIFIEHMENNLFEPLTACKFISYIIVNDRKPVSVTTEFDWSLIQDAPMDWAYIIAPKSNSTALVEKLSIIKTLEKSHGQDSVK